MHRALTNTAAIRDLVIFVVAGCVEVERFSGRRSGSLGGGSEGFVAPAHLDHIRRSE